MAKALLETVRERKEQVLGATLRVLRYTLFECCAMGESQLYWTHWASIKAKGTIST